MEIRCGDVLVCGVEHGTGRLVLVLHGAGVDSREVEACSEPGLAAPGLRRVSPDLPGHGRTAAPPSCCSAEDVPAECPHATLAVVDGAGHALPHESMQHLAVPEPVLGWQTYERVLDGAFVLSLWQRSAARCVRPDLMEGSGADSDDGGGRDLEQRSSRQTGSAHTRGRGG